jgi:1,4-alpha-glucan branching enzyme
VVLVTADYPPDVWSGIGVAVHRQASDLAALGVDVTVLFVGRRSSGLRGSNPDSNLTLLELAASDPLPEIAGGAAWIHLHSLALTELALELRRRTGAKLACTVHTQPWLELSDHPRRRFWLDMQARLLGECDRVVFLSAAERSSAEALFPSLAPAHVIPNGVPPPPAQLPGRDARHTILFAGRFARSKGVDVLAACIQRLGRENGTRVLVIGGHGDEEGTAAVQRIARTRGGACQVEAWLSREELDDRLAHSLLVLVPSRYEPFGLIALEAMRLGAPVLAANAGGLRDTVRPGSGGLLLDSHDPRRWAEASLRLLRDPALWTSLHRQGPEFVGTHYRSSDLAARLLHDVYDGGVLSS